jgi:hypothetical protein
MSGIVLENKLKGIIESALGTISTVYRRVYDKKTGHVPWRAIGTVQSSRLRVYRWMQLGVYFRAYFEASKQSIWQLAYNGVLCSVIDSIQSTKLHTYHSNLVII